MKKGEKLVNYMSEAGRHHEFDNANNQDVVMFKKNKKFCAMALADGVSTCNKSRDGARVTCNAVIEYLLEHGERFFNLNMQDVSKCLISYILFKLKEEVKQSNFSLIDYSSTVACILVDRKSNRMLYFSVGDSLIMAVKKYGCSIIAMPADSRNGCCVTTTSNVATMAKFGVVDTNDINSVMICSDGAWHLMYNRNRLNQSIKDTLVEQNYAKLKEILFIQDRFDDCSFISINLNELQRRKSA